MHWISKITIVLLNLIVFLPTSGEAHFDQIVKNDLQDKWLPALNSQQLVQRFAATQAFLHFPDWSLPIIRQALQNPQFNSIHWRLAYLLGVSGPQTDVALLLKLFPKEHSAFEQEVWKGAAERIFWRHRKTPSRQFIISRLTFSPHNRKNDTIDGNLLYKIVNPDNEGRLINTHVDLWHVYKKSTLSHSYYWTEAGRPIEIKTPFRFTVFPRQKTINIRLTVSEVGANRTLAQHKIKIRLPAASSP
ncbi:MAG: hypothetical protein HQM14_12580 [SAR324 cluster bacterium]|nr:hypothetical protein [SAR324 cluster bacterium]